MEIPVFNAENLGDTINNLRQQITERRKHIVERHEAAKNAIREEIRRLFEIDLNSALPEATRNGLKGEIYTSLAIYEATYRFTFESREFTLQRKFGDNNALVWTIRSLNSYKEFNHDSLQQELLLFLTSFIEESKT